MIDKKEVAKLIYNELKNGTVESTLLLISRELEKEKTDKLKFTKTPLLNSIGQELGKLIINDTQKFAKLLGLWKKGDRDERLIVISALGWISRKDYENTKGFILQILNNIYDWEICDQLALRVIVNLAVHNQQQIFSMMEQWIKSGNKWVKRLAVATIPPYIRAKKTESKVCLKFLDKEMQEEDKEVKKAVGWDLREITKKDEIRVFKFLKKWAMVENKNTKWIIKEGMKKLSKKQKEELNYLLKRS